MSEVDVETAKGEGGRDKKRVERGDAMVRTTRENGRLRERLEEAHLRSKINIGLNDHDLCDVEESKKADGATR